MSFYNDVLIELMTAVGAALFVGNVFALIRRRDVPSGTEHGAVQAAPVARTVLYLIIGLVVTVWGIASLIG